MKIHFKILRRWYVAAAIICPILCFMAFLGVVGGFNIFFVWSLGICGLVVYLSLPFRRVNRSPQGLKEMVLFSLKFSGAYLFYMWLIKVGDIGSVVRKLSAEHAFFHWELITAVAIWTGLAIYKNLRLVNDLTDEVLFNYLNRKN